MAPTEDDSSSRPLQQGQQSTDDDSPKYQRFSARIESFRDISALDFGGYHRDEYVSPPSSPTLRGRESLVSLSTQDSGSTLDLGRSDSDRWSNPLSTPGGGGYQPVAETKMGSLSVPGIGRTRSSRSICSGRHSLANPTIVETIPEGRESLEMALLPAAAPIYGAGPSESGPDSLAHLDGNNEERRIRQEQEQAGKLSGGLGVGFKPVTTIRETDLLSPTSPIIGRTPSRSGSFLRRTSFLSRSATLKALGQSEADRTGQAVQVIIEDTESDEHKNKTLNHRDSDVDLSVVAGGPLDSAEEPSNLKMRSSTFSSKIQRTETFYPHPNWKPFSMRWPYLAMLIILSVQLAGLTEVLYQSSARNPLVTFSKPQEINPGAYFAIKFMPTIIAVVYGVLWQITDFEVKRLEAYYQLSKEGGATAAETLNVDYITSFNLLRPIRAFQLRHFAVTISSVASLLAVSAVPTLSAASIYLSPDRVERLNDPSGVKKILVHPVYSRLLEVMLILIALMGCVLFYQLGSRRSGLLADVRGIAGLAAMANVSHILMDFKDTDVASHKDIGHKLAHHRYVLRNSSLAPCDDGYSIYEKSGDSASRSEPKYHLSLNPQTLMLRAAGCIPFITGILLFAIFLPILLFTPAGYLADKAPWVVTALAVCIKLAWGVLDTNVRMIEPFYILYRRHASPKTLTLDYTAMPFVWVALSALLNRHWLVFAVGFGTVMTEILTVLVTSLAAVEGRDFLEQIKAQAHGLNGHGSSQSSGESLSDINSGQETVRSFWISLVIAMCILLYMVLVATVVFVRRRKPFLPRQPNTIASVLAFIHQSKMLYDFVGTEKYSNKEMVRFLEGTGKTYGLGWFEGRDGRTHCGVDQEELIAGYRHGLDYSRSNKPWVESFSEWL